MLFHTNCSVILFGCLAIILVYGFNYKRVYDARVVSMERWAEVQYVFKVGLEGISEHYGGFCFCVKGVIENQVSPEIACIA